MAPAKVDQLLFWLSCHRIAARSTYAGAIILAGLIVLNGCSIYPSKEQAKEQQRRDANTPAGKMGQAAHKAAVEVGKAGAVIGQKLDKAAHDAHAGWNEAARKDQSKK